MKKSVSQIPQKPKAAQYFQHRQ